MNQQNNWIENPTQRKLNREEKLNWDQVWVSEKPRVGI